MTAPKPIDASLYRRLFEGAGLAIFACDANGTVAAWNPDGQRLFADTCQTGKPLRDLLPEGDRPTFDSHLAQCLQTREPLEFRTRLTRPDGRSTEYAVWLAPLVDEGGALEGASVWFHDITARLQVRRSVRKHERLSTLGALSGAIAHHYNNFLCSIVTSLEYAMNMNTMVAMKRALQRTADAVARAAQLTQQLLAFAQADHRSGDLSDLTETVLFYFDQHESRLAQRDIRLKLDWQPIPSVTVPREHLLIVLNNLVENASDVMPNGGTLTVNLRRRDADSVCLSLTDTGGGIDPEMMDHLFEPLYNTKGVLGSGLSSKAGMGLAVVHGLVGEMHGAVTASNVGGGARFDVILPVDAAL